MSSTGLKWLKTGFILAIITKTDDRTAQQLERRAESGDSVPTSQLNHHHPGEVSSSPDHGFLPIQCTNTNLSGHRTSLNITHKLLGEVPENRKAWRTHRCLEAYSLSHKLSPPLQCLALGLSWRTWHESDQFYLRVISNRRVRTSSVSFVI